MEEAWENGDLLLSDLEEWAHILGGILGYRHAMSRTQDGLQAQSIIASDIEAGGGASILVQELLHMNAVDHQRLQEDFVLFQQIAENAVDTP